MIDYRAYQQTLPASVIDGGTLTDDEKVAWTNGTRAGTIDKPVAPIGSSPYTRGIGGSTAGSIFGGVNTLFYISDHLRAEQDFDRNDTRPEYIPQDEWDACATTGGDDWLGNIFDGLRDWTASFDGVDCNDVRAGWELPRNPDYEPIGQSTSGPSGYPATSTNTTFSLTATLHPPFWSNDLTTASSDSPTRVEGWIVPVTWTGTTSKQLNVDVDWIDSAGVVRYSESVPVSGTGVAQQRPSGTHSQCATVYMCFRVSYTGTTPAEKTYNGEPLMASVKRFGIYSSNYVTMQPLPYINPTDGSTYTPGLARQVLLTSVRTEAGNLYQCRTESFVETAPTIPRPCEPEVPDWEIITERTVEVVPETDTGYVPGSNPTRGIQTTTVPDVVRDWQRDHPGCDETLCLLDLELEGVGSCFDNPEECADWYTDPNKTTRYTCTYGGSVVDLGQCVKYARLFKPGALQQGTAYPQPGTSNPSAGPSAPTSSPPNTSTAPGTSVSDPTRNRDCFPTGWGIFNPFEWVFKPVKCALEWAFVPRQEVVNTITNGMRAKWAGSSLVSLLGVLEEGTELTLGASGCSGPLVSLNIMGGEYSGYPLSACADPMSGVATASRVLTMIGAWVMAGASIARSIAGVVGFTKLGGDS